MEPGQTLTNVPFDWGAQAGAGPTVHGLVSTVSDWTPTKKREDGRLARTNRIEMAELSFALFEANDRGVSVEELASTLGLPDFWVAERIEAARLCLVLGEA